MAYSLWLRGDIGTVQGTDDYAELSLNEAERLSARNVIQVRNAQYMEVGKKLRFESIFGDGEIPSSRGLWIEISDEQSREFHLPQYCRRFGQEL